MKALNEKWIDLYSLLEVPVDADEATLEKQIRAFETQMVDERHPQLAAQCRRILLDADCRTRYNRVRAQHRAGSPTAIDFQAFVSTIQGSDARRHLAAVAEPLPVAPVVPESRRKSALSPNTINLMTGVVATLLINYIQTGTGVLPGM